MNNEEAFTSLIAIQLPEGSTMTILDGVVYEGDVYGIIRVTEGVAEHLCKDRRFTRCDVKKRTIADPAEASREQDNITKAVVEESVKAGAKVQEDIAVADTKPVGNAFIFSAAAKK